MVQRLGAGHDYTLDQIVEAGKAVGLTSRRELPLSRAQYHRLFQNPIYYGVIRYLEENYEGKHEPLVSKELFDRVQKAMRQKSKPKTSKLKPYVCRGMFHCGECGRLITTEQQKGVNYLRCTKWHIKCTQRYVREDQIAKQTTDALRFVALLDGLDVRGGGKRTGRGCGCRDILCPKRRRSDSGD